MQRFAFIATTPRDWSEDELLRRVLAYDGRAWSELVRRYRPVIFRCITRILGRGSFSSGTDAEEVYAEVMMGLWRDDMRKLRLYDPARGAKLGSWIGLLAKNAAHDYIRAHAGKPQPDPMDRAVDIDSQRESPLDDMLRSERHARLEELLAEYSAKDREFFTLYFGRGMSVEEVAVEMGISVKTVYTKKHKLLTRLATNVGHA
jgi:RNA polymerase sigma-70 factor (ECF subfamily)